MVSSVYLLELNHRAKELEYLMVYWLTQGNVCSPLLLGETLDYKQVYKDTWVHFLTNPGGLVNMVHNLEWQVNILVCVNTWLL